MEGTSNYLSELWIGIKADYSSLQAGLKMSQNQIRSFVGHIGNSSEQLRKFGRTTTIVSGLVVAFGAIINKTFAQFEQSMANTYSVLGANALQMQKLEAYARQMGETTIFKASDAADAMYYLASAGYDTEKIMASLKGTLNLAAATQYDLAETTRGVVSALNAFGLEANQADRVANVFSATISGSQATMERLMDSMKYIAPVAAQLGISIEETSATLGLLYNAGIAASQAGTYLRQGLVRLQAPTQEAVDAIHGLGLSLDDVNPQMHSLTEIIGAFEKAGAGAIDKGDELSKIFDLRALNAFQVLIRGGASEMERLEKKITGTNKAQEMAEIQINTFKGSWKLLQSAMQEAAIQIGSSLQPLLRSLQVILMNLVKGFNAMPKPIKTLLATVLALGAGFGLIVGPVAMLLGRLPALISMITALGVSTKVALGWVGLIAIAITGIIAAIGAYGNAQTTFYENSNRVKGETQKEISAFDLLTKKYYDLRNITNKTAGEKQLYEKTIKDLNDLYPNYLKNVDLEKSKLEDVKKALDEARKSLKEYLDQKIIQAVLEDDQNAYTEYGKKIIQTQDEIYSKMNGLRQQIKDSEGLFGSIVDKIKGGGMPLTQIMAADIIGLKGQIKEYEDEQAKLFEKIQKNEKKLQDMKLLDKAPPTGTNLTGQEVTECPEGYVWDDKKKMCVPIKPTTDGGLETADEKKNRELNLQQALYQIKMDAATAQLKLNELTANKSFEQDKEYLLRKKLIEEASLMNWKEQELLKLDGLQATAEQKQEVEKAYLDKVAAMNAEFDEETKKMNEKWFAYDLSLKENMLGSEIRINKEALLEYKKSLEDRLAVLTAEGKKWTDEYTAIYNKIKNVDQQIAAPRENKRQFDFDQVEQFGTDDQYTKALEDYQNYLNEQLLLYSEWSDEYVGIMRQIADVKDKQVNHELERNRFLFFSIKDMANAASNSIWAGFDTMWNKYVIGAREAKNDLDAVWLAMKTSFLNTLRQILEAEVTKLLLKLIGSLFGPVGGFIGGLTGAAISSPAVPASPVGAIGAEVKQTGKMIVHKDELVVPARIIRANDSKYQEAARVGLSDTNKKTASSNYNFNVVVNNPSVDDKRYWESVVEQHVEPAFVKLKKRYE